MVLPLALGMIQWLYWRQAYLRLFWLGTSRSPSRSAYIGSQWWHTHRWAHWTLILLRSTLCKMSITRPCMPAPLHIKTPQKAHVKQLLMFLKRLTMIVVCYGLAKWLQRQESNELEDCRTCYQISSILLSVRHKPENQRLNSITSKQHSMS